MPHPQSLKTILFCLFFSCILTIQGQSDTIVPLQNPKEQMLEPQATQESVAPVVFRKDTMFLIAFAPEQYPVKFRAGQISRRLEMISREYKEAVDSIYLETARDYIKVMYNDELAFLITQNDAEVNNMTLQALGESQILKIRKHLDKSRDYELTTKEWLIRIGYFLLSILILIALLWVIRLVFRKLNLRLSKIEKKFLKNKRNVFKYFIPRNTTNIFVFISNVAKYIILLFVLFTYLPFMFSFFPWTEDIVNTFYSYLARPIRFVFFGFIDFLPNLIFIIVILYVTRYINRVLGDIVVDIEEEKFIISGFPKEWAGTTQKIVSLLIWAFALVLVYPHLPGATSPAFKGVSIFIGALISFGSTSAIANIVAGIVITYMSPYKIGDRVKIQDTIGDVIEKTLLVTRIRTTKNEDVTIPNANIITNHLINYSANVEKSGLLLHTSVTIGYDVPWQQVEKLLCEAAKKSIHIEKEPVPFVLQKSLDDNYVSYELNAYTKEIRKMPAIYSDIHKNILDIFDQEGVEILSPQYVAARDGNLSTVPSKLSPESKSPIEKIVDHLTGQNQKIRVKKSDSKSENETGSSEE
jgi:small-conductance mechanosensitive channel